MRIAQHTSHLMAMERRKSNSFISIFKVWDFDALRIVRLLENISMVLQILVNSLIERRACSLIVKSLQQKGL